MGLGSARHLRAQAETLTYAERGRNAMMTVFRSSHMQVVRHPVSRFPVLGSSLTLCVDLPFGATCGLFVNVLSVDILA